MRRIEAESISGTADLVIVDGIRAGLGNDTAGEFVNGVLPVADVWAHHREIMSSVSLVSAVGVGVEVAVRLHAGILLRISERHELGIP